MKSFHFSGPWFVSLLRFLERGRMKRSRKRGLSQIFQRIERLEQRTLLSALAVVMTDQPDYPPGAVATITGTDFEPGEEIVVQGFTCVVVPNAIHAAGGVPVYADIDPDTLNLTSASVRPLLTSRTRAVICQHTFGIPADIKALRKLCDERGIVLIGTVGCGAWSAQGDGAAGGTGICERQRSRCYWHHGLEVAPVGGDTFNTESDSWPSMSR